VAEVSNSASTVRSGPRLVRGNLPDWLQDSAEALLHLAPKGAVGSNLKPASNATPESWTVQVDPKQKAQWIKPTADKSAGGALSQTSSAHSLDTPPVTYTRVGNLPLELTATKIPRQIKFYKGCGRDNPMTYQLCMIFNPLVWMMVVLFFMVFTTDDALRREGVNYPGTITNVQYKLGKDAHAKVDLQYKVNGKIYSRSFDEQLASGNNQVGYDEKWEAGKYHIGDQYMVRALPSKPIVVEPARRASGFKEFADLLLASVFLFLNLLLEKWIWSSQIKHARLARKGVPVEGKIEWMRPYNSMSSSSTGLTYSANVSYVYQYQTYYKTVGITEYESLRMTAGSKETLLVDPSSPRDFAIYKFCRFHPVLPKSMVHGQSQAQVSQPAQTWLSKVNQLNLLRQGQASSTKKPPQP
jgi:Protein of unknown function (DUF3592)